MCEVNENKDECHIDQHCRWSHTSPAQLMWWTADHILQNSYCTDIGGLIDAIQKGQNSTLTLCDKILGCTSEHVENTCGLLYEDDERDKL